MGRRALDADAPNYCATATLIPVLVSPEPRAWSTLSGPRLCCLQWCVAAPRLRPWGGSPAAPACSRFLQTFNVCPAFRPGRPRQMRSPVTSSPRLQWWPGVSAGETPALQKPCWPRPGRAVFERSRERAGTRNKSGQACRGAVTGPELPHNPMARNAFERSRGSRRRRTGRNRTAGARQADDNGEQRRRGRGPGSRSRSTPEPEKRNPAGSLQTGGASRVMFHASAKRAERADYSELARPVNLQHHIQAGAVQTGSTGRRLA